MKRKGFTLVELLVVIAIIAILATVSIVGYVAFTKKSRISNDEAIVAQLNLVMQGNETLGEKASTADEAVNQAINNGFIVGNLTPTTSGYHIVYDLERNRFILLDENNDFVYGDNASKTAYDKTKLYNYFKVVHVAQEEATVLNTFEFAPYLYVENSDQSLVKESWTNDTLIINTGFDTGNVSSIKNIKYINDNAEARNVVIRTYGSTLTIDGENDTVSHYGLVCQSNVVNVNNIACYDEYGIVGRLVYQDNSGKLNIKDGSVIFCYMNVSQDASMDAKNITNLNATIYAYVDSAEAQQAIAAGKDVNEIKRGKLTLKLAKDGTVLVSKCDGHKDSDNYEVFDSKYGTFIICKKCGGYCLYNKGTITQKSEGISEENNNVFIIIPVTSITLDKNTAEILIGKQLTLTAEVLPVDATIKSVYWTSDNTKVATVEDGLVVGRSVGSVVIKAIANGGVDVYATCVVNVVKEKCDHNYELIETFEVSCTEDGYKKYKCSKCKHVKKEITATALGHDWEVADASGEHHCKRCENYYLDETGAVQIWTDNMFVYSDEDLTSIKRLTHVKSNEELANESNLVNIPNKVENIEEGAFANCDFIKDIIFNSDVVVADDAFYGCANISNIDGNDKTIELGNGSFNMFDATVATVIKNCNFVIKTGNIGINLETYGSSITFENCSFIINEYDKDGDKNNYTSALLVKDCENSEKTIIILKNTNIKVKNVNGNIATFIQLYLTNTENVLVKVEDTCSLDFESGETYFTVATAGSKNVECNVYTGTINKSKLQDKGIRISVQINEYYYQIKTLEQYDADTAEVKPGEDNQPTLVSSFAELSAALANVDIKNIKLTADISINNFAQITRDVEIDLNGKELKLSNYEGVLYVGGDLVKGEYVAHTVKIKNGKLKADDSVGILVMPNCTLEISGITFTDNCCAVYYCSDTTIIVDGNKLTKDTANIVANVE